MDRRNLLTALFGAAGLSRIAAADGPIKSKQDGGDPESAIMAGKALLQRKCAEACRIEFTGSPEALLDAFDTAQQFYLWSVTGRVRVMPTGSRLAYPSSFRCELVWTPQGYRVHKVILGGMEL